MWWVFDRAARLREAHLTQDESARKAWALSQRLTWLSWVAVGAGTAVSLLASIVFDLSAEASVYFLYAGFFVMLMMLIYGGFLRANVDAAAMRALRFSLSGGVGEVGFWARIGSGFIFIVLMVVIVAASISDAVGILPFKAMDVLWAFLGIMLLAAVVFRAYKEIRKRIG